MAWGREKLLTTLCVASYFFLCGVEYAVILPTVNGYLLSLQGTEDFLGIIMASFSLTGLIAAPIYGWISDHTRSTKVCIVVANLFEIVGNILYFMSWNKYVLWVSRLIAGTGPGVRSAIFGMISRSTSTEERTSLYSLLLGLPQIGIVIGPVFNIFLHGLNFQIGPYEVNQYTSPGLFMAVVWAVHTLLVVFIFKEMVAPPPGGDSTQAGGGNQENGDSGIDESSTERTKPETSVRSFPPARTFVKEFLREQVVVCLFGSFTVVFSQTGFEAVLTPLTLLFFGWGDLENSYLYIGVGVLVVLSFIGLAFLSKKVADRFLLLAGCVGMVVAYSIILCYSVVLYIGDYVTMPKWLLPVFLIDAIIMIISLPYVWVPQASLFSKITSIETQGFNHGVRLATMGLGQITGPIWTTPLATIDRMYIMFSVNLFFLCLLTILVCASFEYLVPTAKSKETDRNVTQIEDNEKTPLLGGGSNSVEI